jgi:hypothetical protein
MNPKLGELIFVCLTGWTALGIVSCVLWYFTRRHVAPEERGERCLQIADAYRDLRDTTGTDGEAYTYEQAAEYWEERARELGVERVPLASRTTPLPKLQGKRVPPWQRAS